MDFIDNAFKKIIQINVINKMFPSLNDTDKNILLKYVINLLNIISICFNFSDKKQIYYEQLQQNDFQDIKWLISHLLPYLNGDKTQLHSFADIYTKKYENVDINKESPSYIYSNIQYNRCNRDNDTYTEIPFSIEHLEHNYYLLIETIKTMSNKLCVNWIDILPETFNKEINNFENNNAYNIFKKKYNENKLTDFDSINDTNPDVIKNKWSGLWIGDVYNIFSVYLYNSVVKCKWLIYDVMAGSQITPMIVVLDKIFDLKNSLLNIQWDNINNEYRNKFSDKWKQIINYAHDNKDVIENGTNIPSETFKKVIKSVVTMFNGNNQLLNFALNEEDNLYKKISFDENESFDNIYENIITLQPKYIYEQIRQSIQKIKHTWYGTYIFTPDKTEFSDNIKISGTINVSQILLNSKKTRIFPIGLSLKNIYNFAESITHYTNDKKYIQLSNLWQSMPLKLQEIFYNRINDQYKDYKILDWFKITKNLTNLNLIDDENEITDNVKQINIKIYYEIRKLIPDILFECLTIHGLLSNFTPNPKKTNLKKTPRDNIKNLQKDVFDLTYEDNNIYWNFAYNYINSLPYKYSTTFKYENKDCNYFKFGEKRSWYEVYAYDWIAQIGFCHHFINNRVVFITGATGIGKSTEIPKLFLYYSLAIDYNDCPRVVCSQPRIPPVNENAESAMRSMGVMNDNSQNPYVQAVHKNKKVDFDDMEDHPILKYITDGTLKNEMTDPIMKNKHDEKNKDVYFFTKNKYDVIMIDESHEHKINMDILLTIAKYSTNYNNKLRLVILSATMDEDDPKYRRFYRDINDNRKYPLNLWIEKHNIDRINVDRRFHISPVGLGTKFPIKDIYKPDKTELEIVKEILERKTPVPSKNGGDILIFEAGLSDITKIIKDFNEKLPNNIIILPFYTDLSDKHKKIISNIREEKYKLKFDRNEDFANVNKFYEGTNNYNRAIIVATNIAEASLTFPSASYVIDTGKQKVNIYDYLNQFNKLEETFISESSRLQRKGRVGRSSSGYVYYLYKENSMKNNKIQYEIAMKDISLDVLFSQLKENNNEKLIIQYDPNLQSQTSTIVSTKSLNDIYNYGIDAMIKSQYYIGNNFYTYFGNSTMYDYQNYNGLMPYFMHGFSDKTLNDEYGNFYIVHPNETLFTRNINGDVVKLTEEGTKTKEIELKNIRKNKNIIISKKMSSFWNTLENYIYITKKNGSYEKIKFGIMLNASIGKLDIKNHNLFRACVFGFLTDNINDMLKLLCIYETLDNDPFKILNKIDNKFDTKKVDLIYGSVQSDSEMLLKILNDLHKFLQTQNIYTDFSHPSYLTNIKFEQFSKDEYISILNNSPTTETRKKIIGKCDKLYAGIEHNMDKYIINTFRKKSDTLLKWCESRGLNYENIYKYIHYYILLKNKIKYYLKDFEDIKKLKNTLSNLNILRHKKFTQQQLITLAFLFGFPQNVCKQINTTDNYISLYKPLFDNLYTINSLVEYKFLIHSFIHEKYIGQYLLYLFPSNTPIKISGLHYITPEIITIFNNIYNKKLFVDEYNNIIKKSKTPYVNTLSIIARECVKLISDVSFSSYFIEK